MDCVVVEGLYGVGFELVKRLCGSGVSRLFLLSKFTLTSRVRKRIEAIEWSLLPLFTFPSSFLSHAHTLRLFVGMLIVPQSPGLFGGLYSHFQ
jgi:hypothetical protein